MIANKPYTLLLLLIAISNIALGQTLRGKYVADGQSLNFEEHTVAYKLASGNYSVDESSAYFIKNNQLEISRAETWVASSNISRSGDKSDTLKIIVNQVDRSQPTEGAGVLVIRKDKTILNTVTDKNGMVHLNRKDFITGDLLSVSYPGYFVTQWQYEQNTQYKITLQLIMTKTAENLFYAAIDKGFEIRVNENWIELKMRQFEGNQPTDRYKWVRFIKQ